MVDHNIYYHHGPGAELGALVGAGVIRNKTVMCLDRRLEDYAVVYLTAGSGWFSHGGGPRHAVTAGDALLLFPGIIHSYGPEAGGRWSEYWLMCRGALFSALHDHGQVDPVRPVVHVGLRPALQAEFADLITTRVAAASRLRTPRATHAEEVELAARAVLLITRLGRAALGDQPETPEWLERACQALSAELHLPIDLRHIAATSGFSYERFRKAFAEAIGMPPARFRLLRRIDRAKALLMIGRDISQVAGQLGFCDVYFFMRQFKAVTGTTPARFRGKSVQRQT